MEMIVSLQNRSYPIYIESGVLKSLKSLLPAKRYAVVTDSGVPQKWKDLVMDQLDDAVLIEFEQGEQNKNFRTFESVLEAMAKANLSRKDAVIALGGGVAGDLAGFAAASYMRGIDFYNIPTTVLSQVDSSVGGKTAIDLGPIKNIVGAFWQPKAVFIDPDVLETLPERQIRNGLAEALKMGLILDEDLVCEFEKETPDLTKIITRSIDLKRQIVEQDEKESSLRKILNFGHTIGHALEGSFPFGTWLHGECVAMGMPFFIEDELTKERTLKILRSLNLPEMPAFDLETVMERMSHDKKSVGSETDVITVTTPGHYQIKRKSLDEIRSMLEEARAE